MLAENCQEAKRENAQQARQTQAESVGSSKSSAQATVRNPAAPKNLPSEVTQRIVAVKNRKPPEPSPIGLAFDPDEPTEMHRLHIERRTSRLKLSSFQIWISAIPDSGSSFFWR